MDHAALDRVIADYFKPQSDVLCVFLYGSTAKNTARADSDVDIAVLLSDLHQDSLMRRLKDASELSERIGKEVDMVLLNEAGPVLTNQVLKYGRLVWELNRSRTTRFKARAMIEYVDWLPYKKRLDDAVLAYFTAPS